MVHNFQSATDVFHNLHANLRYVRTDSVNHRKT